MSGYTATNDPTVCWQCFKSNHAACANVHGKPLNAYGMKCQCGHKRDGYIRFVNPVRPDRRRAA